VPDLDLGLRRARWALATTGALLLGFFAVATPVALLDLLDHRSAAGQLLMWREHGTEYVVMIGGMNMALGVGMITASRDPLGRRHAVDLAIGIHGAHMATMLLMALVVVDHRAHLAGDVPLGLAGLVLVLATWLPVRRASAVTGGATT
jgi:hypothetical protein